jgi:hypothetical protein
LQEKLESLVKELEREVGELEEEVSSVNHNIAENKVSPPAPPPPTGTVGRNGFV